MRGHKPAGYGFVTMSSEEAAQKAVELLDAQELDGRPVIVQIAKPADQKDKEKKEKKAKRRPNRRGAKAVPGEVTDAEANSDVKTEDVAVADAPGTDEAAKPKKRKKKSGVCDIQSFLPTVAHATHFAYSADLTAGLLLWKVVKRLPQRVLLRMSMPLPPPGSSIASGSPEPALSAKTLMVNPPKTCFSSPTSALMLMMRISLRSLLKLVSTLFPPALFVAGGATPGRARVTALSMLAVRKSRRRRWRLSRARRSAAVPSLSRSPSILPLLLRKSTLARKSPMPSAPPSARYVTPIPCPLTLH
jgi:hypothetical protein